MRQDASHALFWLAQQVGATDVRTRKWQIRELVSPFVTARRAAFRVAEAVRVGQPTLRGGWSALAEALQNVPLTSEEQRKLGYPC